MSEDLLYRIFWGKKKVRATILRSASISRKVRWETIQKIKWGRQTVKNVNCIRKNLPRKNQNAHQKPLQKSMLNNKKRTSLLCTLFAFTALIFQQPEHISISREMNPAQMKCDAHVVSFAISSFFFHEIQNLHCSSHTINAIHFRWENTMAIYSFWRHNHFIRFNKCWYGTRCTSSSSTPSFIHSTIQARNN